jgi:preprotein translocase subunit SecG
MEQLLLILYVLVCAAMIGLILLQQGKGADMGASFGSGSSQTMFGPAGSGNVLTRGTAIFATAFFVISLGLAMIAKDKAEEARSGEIPLPALIESSVNQELPELPASNNEAASDIPALDAGEVDAPIADDVPALDDELPAEQAASDEESEL